MVERKKKKKPCDTCGTEEDRLFVEKEDRLEEKQVSEQAEEWFENATQTGSL